MQARMGPQERRWSAGALGAAVLAALLVCAPGWAYAQTRQPLPCSSTVGTGAAAIAFANGYPKEYVMVTNPSATATLWLNDTGGTAAANAAGSFPLNGQGNSATLVPTPSISIIASAGSTPYTCEYR